MRAMTERLWLAGLAVCALACGDTKPEPANDDDTKPVPTNDDDGAGGSASGTGGAATVSTAASTGGAAAVTTAASTGGAAGTCSIHTDCSADEICLDSSCNLAWGRMFRFTAISADIPGTNPNTGAAWDPLNGAPDPYVDAHDDGALVSTTSVIDDSFTPAWNEFTDILLKKDGGLIGFYVYDEDTIGDDYITGLEGAPSGWLVVVREADGVLVGNDQGIIFNMTVVPQ